MTNQHLREINDKIEAEIKRTVADIDSLEALIKPIAPDNAIGRLTRMEAINAKSVNEAALRGARHKLTRLRHALEHVGDDNFGICTECGKQIPVGRILLMPESDMCVQCAENFE